jgi:hypothetical protein
MQHCKLVGSVHGICLVPGPARFEPRVCFADVIRLQAPSETKTIPVPASDMDYLTPPSLDLSSRTMDLSLDRPNIRIAQSAQYNRNHVVHDSLRQVPVTFIMGIILYRILNDTFLL